MIVLFVCLFFCFHFPQTRYNPRHSGVKQMTLKKYTKVVKVLIDIVVATYAFLNGSQLLLVDKAVHRINHLT